MRLRLKLSQTDSSDFLHRGKCVNECFRAVFRLSRSRVKNLQWLFVSST